MSPHHVLSAYSTLSAFSARIAAAVILCGLAVGFIGLPVALAAIPSFVWEAPEPVEPGVYDVSDPRVISIAPGRADEGEDGFWYIVYVKGDDIYMRVRDLAGWRPAVRISDDPGQSNQPSIGVGRDVIHVVWNDLRSGQWEVWGRTCRSGVWSPETCLSEGGSPSVQPALEVTGADDCAIVVWDDSQVAIRGRTYDGGVWSDVITFAEATSHIPVLLDPAVSSVERDHYVVVWLGMDPVWRCDIYQRWYRNGLEPEQRITNMSASLWETRAPVVRIEPTWSGVLQTEPTIVFQMTNEIWEVCGRTNAPPPVRVSPNDGLYSGFPAMASFLETRQTCSWHSLEEMYLPIWTDLVTGGRRHMLGESGACAPTGNTEIVTTHGVGWATAAAVTGVPRSRVLVLYVEQPGAEPVLMARRGSLVRCQVSAAVEPPALVIGPAGRPANEILVEQVCDGTPLSGQTFVPTLDPAVDAGLTWAAGQVHDPNGPYPGVTLPAVTTDDQGRATLAIHGGGCAQGPVDLYCAEDRTLRRYEGIKSPDVNADCIVDLEDLIYVRSNIGTDDFCADLDGSGLVDPADSALVALFNGDRCPDPAGMDDALGGLRTLPSLDAFPNPCRAQATVAYCDPLGPGRTRIQVFDAGGRLVRNLETAAKPGSTAFVRWDTRDDQGRGVAAGYYLIVMLSGHRKLVEPLLVVR